MVDFIMLGMTKFHENSKIKSGIHVARSHTMRDANILEGWITYDTLCTYQVSSNFGGSLANFCWNDP